MAVSFFKGEMEMEKKLNSTIDFTFEDGRTVKMTLTFYKLYQLKSIHKGLYDRYNKVMTKGADDELDMITVLYAAYVCANMDVEDRMTEEEFMIACGSDRMAIKEALEKLTKAKKQ